MGDLTKDFSRSEFACKCGCGYDRIDPRVVDMCQVIRDGLGASIRINSACRCERRNTKRSISLQTREKRAFLRMPVFRAIRIISLK